MDLDLTAPRSLLLLTLADDELVTGHRHSHWTGVAPSLEEDLAFSTLAQDEINHADVWLQILVGSNDRDAVDALALGRKPDEYRHAVLCERPPLDFAYTLARQWLYDHFDAIRLGQLADSTDADIAAVATKLLHEERYHLEHADSWVRRFSGDDTAREKLAVGLRAVWPEALWLFEPLPREDEMVADGLMPTFTASWLVRWAELMVAMHDEIGLADIIPTDLTMSGDGWVLPDDFFATPGGRRGVHTEDWTSAWEEMTHLHRAHPGAQW